MPTSPSPGLLDHDQLLLEDLQTSQLIDSLAGLGEHEGVAPSLPEAPHMVCLIVFLITATRTAADFLTDAKVLGTS